MFVDTTAPPVPDSLNDQQPFGTSSVRLSNTSDAGSAASPSFTIDFGLATGRKWQ